MSGTSVERLFDEFAAAYARGERPDVAAVLARAGEEADALASLLDAFLAAVPARETRAEDVELMQARLAGEPPLLALRLRRRLTRDAVVDALMGLLRLDPGKRTKVRAYFSDLEAGVLDPKGVAPAVWDALGKVLGADAVARALAGGKGVSLSVETAYYRVAGKPELAGADAVAPAPPAAGPDRPDEIDRLFTSGN
ncbi:hypothetical protein Gocc_1254 [Gaiella occulta]|uniref:Uncharacterized protein n=1 Tax=Gaiella occulta TaxID=1002870 RepID=A0A7M2YZC7_9ACTN|nr:hypothetical protein [Gaiella occulta]RDI75456.1 hypothetical protein Gocc_1254 [Gaiella occulta]